MLRWNWGDSKTAMDEDDDDEAFKALVGITCSSPPFPVGEPGLWKGNIIMNSDLTVIFVDEQ